MEQAAHEHTGGSCIPGNKCTHGPILLLTMLLQTSSPGQPKIGRIYQNSTTSKASSQVRCLARVVPVILRTCHILTQNLFTSTYIAQCCRVDDGETCTSEGWLCRGLPNQTARFHVQGRQHASSSEGKEGLETRVNLNSEGMDKTYHTYICIHTQTLPIELSVVAACMLTPRPLQRF